MDRQTDRQDTGVDHIRIHKKDRSILSRNRKEERRRMSVRRTWDKELYAAKAKARAEETALQESEEQLAEDLAAIKKRKADDMAGGSGAGGGGAGDKEEFQAADSGAAGPVNSQRAFLKARTTNLSDQMVQRAGKIEVVTSQAMEMGVGGGFWCETCSCLLKDSSAYLNHINGKKHQRALGFSMRVESVGVSSVKDRLSALKSKLAAKSTTTTTTSSSSSSSNSSTGEADAAPASALHEHDLRISEREGDEQERKRARKEAKAAAKARARSSAAALQADDGDGAGDGAGGGPEGVDPDMAAMMGFSGFGGK